jgi:hypothetical protein
MRLLVQLSFLLPFALSWFSVSASINAHQGRRHHAKRIGSDDLAVRAPGDLDMYKRDFPNSRLTYYAVGLGACGAVNQPGDFVCGPFNEFPDAELSCLDSCTKFSGKKMFFFLSLSRSLNGF